MINIIKNLNNLKLVIFIFCFLFAPPIIGNFNFIFIVFTYSTVMIILKYRSKLNKLLNIKKIRKIFLILFLYFCIYVISILFNYIKDGNLYENNYIINMYSLILAFPITIVCSMYLIFRCDELKIDLDNLIKLFIIAGLVQTVIALLALLFPTIKEWTVSTMYKATGDKLLGSSWLTERRFYGFANSMLDTFGFGTGILAAIPIFYASKTDKKIYYILAPILLIVPMLNSRSGLIMFLVGLIIYFVYLGIKKEIKFGAYCKYIILIGVILALGIYMVSIWSPNTIQWIAKDVKSFVVSEGEEGTADQLFSKEFWQLPPALGLIIGTGHNISGYSDYAIEGVEHSDVGYINELWKSGIIGLILLYYFTHSSLNIATQSVDNNKYKAMFIFFEVASYIFSIKATIYTYNPGNVVIYTLLFMSIYNHNKEIKNHERELSFYNNTSL